MMDQLRATPTNAKWALAAAVLAFIGVIKFTETLTVNGVAECSRIEIGAFAFGGLALGTGIAAMLQTIRQRQQAKEERPLTVSLWTRNSTAVNLAVGMAAIGILFGAYRFAWAISVMSTCP